MTKERIMAWLADEGPVELKSLLKAPGLLKARLESMAEHAAKQPPTPEASVMDATQRRALLLAVRAVWAQMTDQERRMLKNALAAAGADMAPLNAILP